MDGNPAQQAFKELLPYLEALDTQNSAILQLLKDKGLTTDEQFAPYLEQAGNVSNVKWLAARLRIDHLLSSIGKERDSDKDKEEEARKTKPSTSEASPRQEPSKRDEEDREPEETAASSENQSDRKGNHEAGDATTADTKRGVKKKDIANQETTEHAPAAKRAKPADSREQETDKQTKKEINSNANEDRDVERDAEKKAS